MAKGVEMGTGSSDRKRSDYLRQKATHCRQRAQAADGAMAADLLELASEYEALARIMAAAERNIAAR